MNIFQERNLLEKLNSEICIPIIIFSNIHKHIPKFIINIFHHKSSDLFKLNTFSLTHSYPFIILYTVYKLIHKFILTIKIKSQRQYIHNLLNSHQPNLIIISNFVYHFFYQQNINMSQTYKNLYFTIYKLIFPNYIVTQEGHLFNKDTNVQVPEYLNGKYLYVHLFNKRIPVHLIIALKYLGPRPTKDHQIDHCNINSTDNSADNLMYVTRRQNCMNRSKMGTTVMVYVDELPEGAIEFRKEDFDNMFIDENKQIYIKLQNHYRKVNLNNGKYSLLDRRHNRQSIDIQDL
ncbi:Conserved_hypothetical protein [Hexamita inflata]|uniref:HNH nuclease domain-containing protein n=1 Tax=Hexamita inflata TaxID=28002 RepID=A0ABP1KTK4_9EUKA